MFVCSNTASHSIQKIKVPSALKTKKLTPQDRARLLVAAYEQHMLADPLFSKIECLKIQQVGKKPVFTVESVCSPAKEKYILKESDDIEQLLRLISASEIPNISVLNQLKSDAFFPRIIFPTAYFSYKNRAVEHYLFLMPVARGKEFSDLLSIKTIQDQEELLQASKHLGFQMGNFYRFYMKPASKKILGPTVIHSDLHDENIFFDAPTNQITLIDNAGMRFFNQDYAVAHDLAWTFEGIFGSNNGSLEMTIVKEFLKGFLQAYQDKSSADKQRILLELADQFRTITTTFFTRLEAVIKELSTELQHEQLLQKDLQSFHRDLLQLGST